MPDPFGSVIFLSSILFVFFFFFDSLRSLCFDLRTLVFDGKFAKYPNTTRTLDLASTCHVDSFDFPLATVFDRSGFKRKGIFNGQFARPTRIIRARQDRRLSFRETLRNPLKRFQTIDIFF